MTILQASIPCKPLNTINLRPEYPRGEGGGTPWKTRLCRLQRRFNPGVHLSLRKLSGHPNTIHDRLLIRRSMADDAHAAHTQQHRTTVLRVIQPLFEFSKRLAR